MADQWTKDERAIEADRVARAKHEALGLPPREPIWTPSDQTDEAATNAEFESLGPAPVDLDDLPPVPGPGEEDG